MTGPSDDRPHIGLRIDHDAEADRWRVDCRTCGIFFAGGIHSDDVVAAAVTAASAHHCDASGPPTGRDPGLTRGRTELPTGATVRPAVLQG